MSFLEFAMDIRPLSRAEMRTNIHLTTLIHEEIACAKLVTTCM
jgi:hypothetical protein